MGVLRTRGRRSDRKSAGARVELEAAERVRAITRKIWADVLGVHPNDDDNFFLLGGDSLLGTVAMVALSDELELSLSLGDLYSHPTIGSLSRHLVSIIRA